RPRLRQLPLPVGLLERDLVVAQVELEPGHVLLIEGEHGLVAELGHGTGDVAQDGVPDHEDGRLARLARVDPDARRALGPEAEAELLTVLQLERRFGGGPVEPEIAW